MPPEHQLIDDEISRAAFDLLLKEPFYAHVLAGMPRVVTDQVKSMGVHWNGQQVVLQANPEWFRKGLAATQRKVALKHEVCTSCSVISSARPTAMRGFTPSPRTWW